MSMTLCIEISILFIEDKREQRQADRIPTHLGLVHLLEYGPLSFVFDGQDLDLDLDAQCHVQTKIHHEKWIVRNGS